MIARPRGSTIVRSLARTGALALVCACASVSSTPGSDAIAIVGVTVIDPSSSAPATPDQTILISDGVIRAVGPLASVDIPAGTRRVDGRGKFAIPGLWDAHVHFMNAGVSALPLFVASGVTSVREMGGYASSTADVRRMHEMGVNILAGTDAGSVLVYPGFGLHEELQRLVEDAKLSPRDALWSATVGPARFARLDDQLGTLSRGKIADVVLLDADPLTNIRNTRRIFAVIQAGRFFSRADLDALLAQVRAAAAH